MTSVRRTMLTDVVLSTIISIVLHQTMINACTPFTPGYHVKIVNDLPRGSPQLRFTCKSKDTDLGNHVLERLRVYEWKFCENIIQTTLFFCTFHWGTKHQSFEVFNSKLNQECVLDSLCDWYAKGDGFYFLDKRGLDAKRYDWLN
ncbi:hypothetical protein OROMI_031820 [Orobanche minor]